MSITKMKIKTTGVVFYGKNEALKGLFNEYKETDDNTLVFEAFDENDFSVVSEKLTGLGDEVDRAVWLIYPKKSSKNYSAKINRDGFISACENLIFRPVAQVSIDEDFSAIRLRFKKYVK